MAIISLVSGILGLTLLPFLGSIVAVITGPMARREIRESQGAAGGEGLATAGMVMGWIGIGLGVLTFCLILLGFLFFIPFAVRSSGLILPAFLAFV
jgi:hypothetical protein